MAQATELKTGDRVEWIRRYYPGKYYAQREVVSKVSGNFAYLTNGYIIHVEDLRKI
jgi:hypothetical protein